MRFIPAWKRCRRDEHTDLVLRVILKMLNILISSLQLNRIEIEYLDKQVVNRLTISICKPQSVMDAIPSILSVHF